MRVVRIDGVDCAFPGCDREAELDADTCERHRGLVSRVSSRPQTARLGRVDGPAALDPSPAAPESRPARMERGPDREAGPTAGPSRLPSPPGRGGKLTVDELHALHARYLAGEQIGRLGMELFRAERFASPASAEESLRKRWKRLGLRYPRDERSVVEPLPERVAALERRVAELESILFTPRREGDPAP